MIILHEYGHFLQDARSLGSAIGNLLSGVSEGFCDFLAAVYYDDKHANTAATRGHMFSWDGNANDALGGTKLTKRAGGGLPVFELLGGYE